MQFLSAFLSNYFKPNIKCLLEFYNFMHASEKIFQSQESR